MADALSDRSPKAGGPTLPVKPAAAPAWPRQVRFVSQLTKACFAVVLAGGRGSRLRQLTDWRAKPAVPFAGKFRLIDFTLSNCVNSGVRRIGVATQYKAQSLIRHVQLGWSFLDGRFDEYVQLLPAQQQVDETHWYAGTADAVYQNQAFISLTGAQYVLILSGDHVYRMDYGRMLAEHVAREADLTIACIEVPRDEARAFGVVQVDERRRVVRFDEKPADPQEIPGQRGRCLVSMGVYVFGAEFLARELARDAADSNSSHDFGKDIIPRLLATHTVIAHRFADSCIENPATPPYWRDVGTLDAYWEANLEMTRVVPELNLYDHDWPIWTYEEQLPPAKFVFDDDDRRGMAVDSLVSGGCIVSGAIVRRSLLFSSVRVHSRALVEDSVVLPGADIGENVVLRRAIVDRGCRIPAGMRIGVDPAADRARFEVTAGGVTLVTRQMLGG
jgi:glucose-1-phosphate adenylyltransferase